MVKEKNWVQIADDDELMQLCKEIIEENSDTVLQYRAGKTKVFNALLGALAIKASKRADMKKCSKILQDMLKNTK